MDRYTDINIKEAYDIENPRDIIKKNSANIMMVVLSART